MITIIPEADKTYWENLRKSGRLPANIRTDGKYLFINSTEDSSEFFGLREDYSL